MTVFQHLFKRINCFAGFSILILCLLFSPYVFAENVTIICNKSVSETHLSKGELKNIFTGKKRGWENGESITIAILKEGDVQKSFCRAHLRKSPSQFISYWKYMQYTGKGQMPKSFDTEKEIIDFVANTRGAIGYVSAVQNTDNVKTLAIE